MKAKLCANSQLPLALCLLSLSLTVLYLAGFLTRAFGAIPPIYGYGIYVYGPSSCPTYAPAAPATIGDITTQTVSPYDPSRLDWGIGESVTCSISGWYSPYIMNDPCAGISN